MQVEEDAQGVGLFATADDIAIQRGIAEFQAGRPIAVAHADEPIVALPVDGLTEASCTAFKALCRPARLRLAVTARRARMIGLDVPGPVLIAIAPQDTRDTVWSAMITRGFQSGL